MQIRNYQDSDFPQVEGLLKTLGLFHPHLDTQDIYSTKIKSDAESIILALQDNKPVGCIFFVYDPWISTIFHLGVHPEYRNKGIASQLLEEAERRIQSREANSVGIHVENQNKEALEFYRKRGYSDFGTYLCLEKSF